MARSNEEHHGRLALCSQTGALGPGDRSRASGGAKRTQADAAQRTARRRRPGCASIGSRRGRYQPQEELRAQLHALQQQLDGVREDQQASAVLIRSLAEQNAQLVHAVDALRARTRWLGVACALLGVTTLGLLIWTLRL